MMQITFAATLFVSFLGSTAAFAPHASSARAFAVNSNGERPNTAPRLSLQLSRKRPRDKEESSNGNHPRNKRSERRGNNDAADSTEFVVDLELAEEVEASPHHRKRRGAVRIERSGKNDAAGNCAEALEEVEATERDVGDSEQTSRNDGSANTDSEKSSTAKPLGRQGRVWEGRLSELADYRKTHGHCNVPRNYSENTKLANWVRTQRMKYKLQQEGKTSPMTALRIQALESLGFEWVLSL